MSHSFRAWFVCLTAGLFFFYEFIQMNMFNVISHAFMQSFHISAEMMGWIDSFYFAANVVFLFLAGYLLDRYSIRRVILSSMLLCVLGTAAIAFTHSQSMAMCLRFLTGIGSAFCFLSCIRLATFWFPKQQIGMVVGAIVTEAMIGGIFSQKPLMLLTQSVGWRHALVIDGCLGLALWCLIYSVVRDRPPVTTPVAEACESAPKTDYRQGFKQAFTRVQNWCIASYTAMMNLPLAILGGIWGIDYLVGRFHCQPTQASGITMALFAGMMLGSPAVGYISDRSRSRRLVMLVGGVALLLSVVYLMSVSSMSVLWLTCLFFGIGFLSGAQVVGYPLVAESSPAAIVAMSVSVVNITTQACMGLSKPLYGWLMDRHQQQHAIIGSYTAADFHAAMIVLPVAILLALVAVMCVRSTTRGPINQNDSITVQH